MNELTDTGIPCIIVEEQLTIKPYFICCCVDSVARAPMQALHQYNGFFGCNWCLHPGKVYPGTKVVKYPVMRTTPRDRTHEDSVRNMQKFEEKKAERIQWNLSIKKLHVNGFIGTSPLIKLKKLNIVDGFVPDYVHSCLLGITKQFTGYWFESQLNVVYSLKGNLKEIDELLLSIRPHSAVKQHPRSIYVRSFWKAKEWLNWLLYYCAPVLLPFMKKQYVDHLLLFVEGLYLLLQEEISFTDLNKANELLREFQVGIVRLYGKFALTYNVHQLLHVIESVYRYGNLSAHNCFPYENANGNLLRGIHGGKGILNQIIHSRNLQKCIDFLTDYLPAESATNFHDEIETLTKQSYRLNDRCFVMGGKNDDSVYGQ